MMRRTLPTLLVGLALLTPALATQAADEPPYTRREDVVYGRKYGVALTLEFLKRRFLT